MADNNRRRSSRILVDNNTSYEETSRYSSRYSSRSGRSSESAAGGDSSPHRRRSAADTYSRYSRDSYGNAQGRGSSSRNSSDGRYKARRSYSGTTRSKKPFIIGALLVVLLLAGAAFAFVGVINGKLQSGVDDALLAQLKNTTYTGKPFYALLLGVDRSEDREGDEEFGVGSSNYRTDSIILARVDPVNKKATLISLPRDTMVDMGENGTQKLNAAYSIGGPAYTVQVVSKLAGVDISHYAEIDFDGFCDVVDALGGVEVDVPITIDDGEAGGHLDAGYQTLSGEDALIMCRTRHTYDDIGAGDLYRAANQRTVLSAIAKKLLNSDPATMINAVNVAADSVTTDLSVTDLLGIASSMRGLDPSTDIYTATMPTTSQYINNLWYEVIDQTKWSAMMKRVDAGQSPTDETVIDSQTGTILSSSGDGSTSGAYGDGDSIEGTGVTKTYSGTVAVRNGTNTVGVAQQAANEIAKLGFTTDVGNADSSTYQNTVVVYNDASKASAAAAIVQAIGAGSILKNDGSYYVTADMLVVIGADYK